MHNLINRMKVKNTNVNMKKSRKQLRKQKRLEKKAKKNEYFLNRHKPGKFVLLPNHMKIVEPEKPITETNSEKKQGSIDDKIKLIQMEKSQQLQLQQEMKKQRKRQLLDANDAEDRNIKKLEKQLKLNKRSSKSVPKSFATDGLDYLLEVCDFDKFQDEKRELDNLDDDFDEDFDAMIHEPTGNSKASDEEKDSSEENLGSDSDQEMDDDNESSKGSVLGDETLHVDSAHNTETLYDKENSHDESDSEADENEDVEENEEAEGDGTWEDIYGRKRSKSGAVIEENCSKYIPPAARQKSQKNSSAIEKLNKLKRTLKGLMNRLAESNMHSISSQLEDLYMNNSRNDMNETLSSLIFESVITHIIAPERLLMEHVMLITILHANIGTEIGAHFLQMIVKKLDNLIPKSGDIENKTLDNSVNVIAQLYNFKICNSQLIYDVLEKLMAKFDEKSIECILHILKAVGFNLRKDDPLALKSLIFSLQKKATQIAIEDNERDNSRIKFMLDILLAIKNNNVTKIPNYDNSYSEHLKKLLKSFIRKGNYVTALNIKLDDLLKAEEKGKWWLVGSAWQGNLIENKPLEKSSNNTVPESFSLKLLELARSQRMNTDARRNIFCVIMSAEDYLDAFEKLLHLGLKNQQDREIIHVLLHCCLQEKQYNPFYGFLAQKFCDYNRKFQLAIKFSAWDKLKAIKESSTSQISNLAKLLTHLFLEKGLPISTLKIVQFTELDKVTLRFMRQTLLGILLHDDLEMCLSVFENIAQSDKLKMFRDSLRLFIHHFLLRNLKTKTGDDDSKRSLLEERAKLVNKLLSANEKKTRF